MKNVTLTLIAFFFAFVLLRHVHPSGFILYQGIVLGAIASILQVAITNYKSQTSLTSLAKDGLLTFFIIYAFVFTVPTTVDRSYSVKMIELMAKQPKGATRIEIDQLYTTYFIEQGGVAKRLEEQLSTGTIREERGTFVLTPKGRMLNWMFHVAQNLFACETASQ